MSRENQIEEMAKIISNIPPIEFPFGSRLQGRRIYTSTKIAEHLYNENYRKQSENTIELPCKVGDVLYVISQMNDKRILPFINTYEVTSITVKKKSVVIWHEMDGYMKNFKQSDFGKTIFLTREEAEQALAKMKGGAE